MHCKPAQRLLFAERDGTLAPDERAALDAHLAGCGECQELRHAMAAAIQDWRNVTARVRAPDPERAWQDIRREIRRSAPEKKAALLGLPRWSLPLAAAAGLTVAAVTAPRWFEDAKPTTTVARLEKARADFVEVGNNSSSVVYVDDQSGWLVVWAVNDTM